MRKQIVFIFIIMFQITSGFAQEKQTAVIEIFYGPYFQTKRYSELQYWGNQYGASVGLLVKKQNINVTYRASEVFTKLNTTTAEKRRELGLSYGLRFFEKSKINVYTLLGFSYGWGAYQNLYRGKPDYNYILPQLNLKMVYQMKMLGITTGLNSGYYYRIREKYNYNPLVLYPYLGLQIML